MEADVHVSKVRSTDSVQTAGEVEQMSGVALGREGFLNHIRLKHQQDSPSEVQQPLRRYQHFHFPRVYEALERRGLVGPLELPDKVVKPMPWQIQRGTDDYTVFLLRVEQLLDQSPTSNGMIDTPDKNKTLFSVIRVKDVLPPASSISNLNASGTEDVKFSISRAGFSSLPSFAPDDSELFLASIVEREANSWNLHLTTFFLDHRMLIKDPSNFSAQRIRRNVETYTTWAKALIAFRRQKYKASGARVEHPRYFCRITTSSSDRPYVVQGTDYYNYTVLYYTALLNTTTVEVFIILEDDFLLLPLQVSSCQLIQLPFQKSTPIDVLKCSAAR
jgi:hypothetical protein